MDLQTRSKRIMNNYFSFTPKWLSVIVLLALIVSCSEDNPTAPPPLRVMASELLKPGKMYWN